MCLGPLSCIFLCEIAESANKQASQHPCTAYVQVNAADDTQTDHCLGGICPPLLNHKSVGIVGWQVLGCAMVKPLGPGCDNELVSELAAFCVHPDYRGSGRGDSLLAYLGDSQVAVLLHAQPLTCCCRLMRHASVVCTR